MRLLDEYRDGAAAKRYAQAIARLVKRPWVIMEICGGQTHAILRFGIDQLLPQEITLIHGPGCPVCVTPAETIDKAVALAARPEVILCSFGDMWRVPGTQGDLFSAKARGGDVRMVYSPLDALDLARRHPERQVVFFAVGFETTAPVSALAVYRAAAEKVTNFSILAANVLVPPAMEAILNSPDCRVQGFLAAGHVCTVTGYESYESLVRRYRVPIVVTGFEPLDILQGIHMCLDMLEKGEPAVANQYSRSVSKSGNRAAQELVQKIFTVTDRHWRGIGLIPNSGLALSPAYADFDAEKRFALPEGPDAGRPGAGSAGAGRPDSICRAGQVLQGLIKPDACPAFGSECTPENPLGAPMVSTEGACAAYYRYRRAKRNAGKDGPTA